MEHHAIDDILSERVLPPEAGTGSPSRQEGHPCNSAAKCFSSLGQGHRPCFFCKPARYPLDSSNDGFPKDSFFPPSISLPGLFYSQNYSIPPINPSSKKHPSSFLLFSTCLRSFTTQQTFEKLMRWVRYCARYWVYNGEKI